MFLELTEPIVTDYVPAARPPWLALAFFVMMLAVAVPWLVTP